MRVAPIRKPSLFQTRANLQEPLQDPMTSRRSASMYLSSIVFLMSRHHDLLRLLDLLGWARRHY